MKNNTHTTGIAHTEKNKFVKVSVSSTGVIPPIAELPAFLESD
jgi:hypothetical protein